MTRPQAGEFSAPAEARLLGDTTTIELYSELLPLALVFAVPWLNLLRVHFLERCSRAARLVRGAWDWREVLTRCASFCVPRGAGVVEEAAPTDVPALSQQTSSPPAEADSRAEDGLSEEELDRRAGMALAAQIKGLTLAKQLELMRANPRGRAWLRTNQGHRQRAGSRSPLGAQNEELMEKLRELKGKMSVMAATPKGGRARAGMDGTHDDVTGPSACGWDDPTLRRLEGDPAFRYDTFYGTVRAVNWEEPVGLPPPQAHAQRSPRSLLHAASSWTRAAAFSPRASTASSPRTTSRSPRVPWNSARSRSRAEPEPGDVRDV